MVGVAVIRGMGRMLRAAPLSPRRSLRATLLGQPTVVDVICERESDLAGVPILPFDLDCLGGRITVKLPTASIFGVTSFSSATGVHEPSVSRFTRAVALVAYESSANDAELATRACETVKHAVQRAADCVTGTCGGTGTAHFWSALDDRWDALPVIL